MKIILIIYELVMGAILVATPVYSQTVNQTIDLRPGWNAVYLEVEPNPRDTASVFAGLPIASVWAWNPRTSPVQFIQNPDELVPNQPGWLVFFPPSRPEAFLTNLFIVQANRAYLIKLEGTSNVTWTITGRPSVREIDWIPNAFNLIGFHVDPLSPPTFKAFLSPSPAHNGQEGYRLNTSGVWELIDPNIATVRSGEAYWIYSKGGSDYTGPLDVEPDQGDGLDYGRTLVELDIQIKNLSSTEVTASVRDLFASNGVPLSYSQFDVNLKRNIWIPLPATLTFPVAGRDEILLRLAVRRVALQSDSQTSILEVSNGTGTRWLVPVSAEKTVQ